MNVPSEEQVRPASWCRRTLLIATAALVLGLAPSARATNIVPNPGFEQAGCGSTPVICGWLPEFGSGMSQDTYAHSGSYSMSLRCGVTGCYPSAGYASLSAHIDPAACPAIGPGTHPASFWFSGDAYVEQLGATFYSGPGCTGERLGADFLEGSTAGVEWQELTGTLLAPPGTQSVYLALAAIALCDDYCDFLANFDDLDLEDTVLPGDSTPPETTISSGPSGTTNSTSASFEFTASEPSTFECSLDSGAFASCSSPASYSGLADGSHSFRVRATDTAGNTDPTPAEQTWTVDANAAPVARFTYSCSALNCNFDAGGSADSDGTVQTYSWDFGDGSSGSGKSAQHDYAQAQSYTVKLTVTDDAGASDTASNAITLIHLSARGYKVKGRQKVDLSWNGAGGASYDVYRDGAKIATIQASSYTDDLNRKGSATYTYKVCAQAVPTVCSNEATVSF
jgi:PKD repeat protein